ncbi:MAG TPA: 5'-3' exonuclease H3TH domain-containing protein [Planctomycetota bacterium]|nr:5'-3' exonuclease H3TH domain-containing protein [Planctomycetota bacterium]
MTLHVVDTSTYLFRAFVSVPPTIVLPGTKQAANALYGLIGTLGRLIRERDVKRIVNVLDDVAADDERIALDPAYKAERRDFPEGLASQCPYVEEVLGAAGFASLIAKGWEADDVIATVARLAHEKGEDVAIVGIDKDLLQVLQPGDSWIDLARDRAFGHADANQVLGVPPERTADFLALAGDSVDAIEGVPGIGKKTAALLVNALGGIDAIYANLDGVLEISGLRGAASIKKKLAENEAGARRALVLATLKANAPVTLDLDACAYRGTTEAGRKLLKEKFGFSSFAEKLPRAD